MRWATTWSVVNIPQCCILLQESQGFLLIFPACLQKLGCCSCFADLYNTTHLLHAQSSINYTGIVCTTTCIYSTQQWCASKLVCNRSKTTGNAASI